MALKNSQYYAIMREYEQIRLKTTIFKMPATKKFIRSFLSLSRWTNPISILSVQYGKKLLNGDESALSSLKEELGILRSSKKHLLTSAGFPKII